LIIQFLHIPVVCEKFLKENKVTVEIDYHVLNGEDAAEGQFPHMVGKHNKHLNMHYIMSQLNF